MPKHKTDGGDHSATAKKAKHDSEVVDLSGVSDEVLLAEVVKRGVNEQLQHRVVEKQVADNYEIGNELGHGASATVYKALHKFSSDAFAVKVIDKAGELNDDETMEAELSILKSLQHRNLVNLHEMYESPTTLWLVMELVGGGDLRHAVGSLTHFDEKFVRDVARQVSDGLHYMHSCGVVHRDIKPENILRVSSAPDSVVKIADFGISARLPTFSKHAFHPNESQRRKGSSTLSDVWGTPQYFAPELIKGAYSSQVDMWALGAMLYEMLTGHICFCPEVRFPSCASAGSSPCCSLMIASLLFRGSWRRILTTAWREPRTSSTTRSERVYPWTRS